MVVINGDNAILGRLSSYVAKQALNGEDIKVVNCEKIIISGSKLDVYEKYRIRRLRGEPFHGPFFPRTCVGIVKRSIRGMLPFHQDRGRKAFRRIKVYEGVPPELEGQKMEEIKASEGKRLEHVKSINIKALTKMLGVK